MKITVPVLDVGLLIVRLPELLMMPDKVSVCVDGALIVAAPLRVIGLLKFSVDRLESKMELAAIVSGAEVVPSADECPTFRVPLFKAMLVLTVLLWSRSKTPPVPAKVKVDTLIALV